MHPILKDPRRLFVYLLAWIPIALLLAAVLEPAHLSVKQSAALCGPMCLIYAFVCLAAWFVCRSFPLRIDNARSIVTIQIANAFIGGALWIVTARLLAKGIGIPMPDLATVLPLIFGVGVLFYLLAVAIQYTFLAVAVSQTARMREEEARRLASNAELRALRAQINPHFLYNSLNSISALTSIDPARARQMCVELSAFLRNTLGLSEQHSIELKQELELIESYLAIEKVRFGNRLSVEQSIPDECLLVSVPPLILQPLVENAIIHGIAGMVDNGFVRITAEQQSDGSTITIENSFDPESQRSTRSGFGLSSVRKRLRAAFGEKSELIVSPGPSSFRVQLSLPRN